METKTDLAQNIAVPTLKNVLKLIGFKEVAANIYLIPSAKKAASQKQKPAFA
ncbi:MAG: hypothetical protein NWQ46_00345 [Spirosomaceae bacterium]|nr:hypothetical protein [Spirosomataceae bacterium]